MALLLPILLYGWLLGVIALFGQTVRSNYRREPAALRGRDPGQAAFNAVLNAVADNPFRLVFWPLVLTVPRATNAAAGLLLPGYRDDRRAARIAALERDLGMAPPDPKPAPPPPLAPPRGGFSKPPAPHGRGSASPRGHTQRDRYGECLECKRAAAVAEQHRDPVDRLREIQARLTTLTRLGPSMLTEDQMREIPWLTAEAEELRFLVEQQRMLAETRAAMSVPSALLVLPPGPMIEPLQRLDDGRLIDPAGYVVRDGTGRVVRRG